MKPGTKPRRENRDGRCLQLSTACALGVPWRDAPKGWEPDMETEEDYWRTPNYVFWGRWRLGLNKLRMHDRQFQPDGTNEPEGYWIAIVDGSVGITHAITMKGKKLHYDPSGCRTQRPHKFIAGYELVPNADN